MAEPTQASFTDCGSYWGLSLVLSDLLIGFAVTPSDISYPYRHLESSASSFFSWLAFKCHVLHLNKNVDSIFESHEKFLLVQIFPN